MTRIHNPYAGRELLEALRAGELDAAPSRAPSADELMRLAFEPESMILRGASGDALTKEGKKALLRELNQGEPIELRLEAVVFRQSLTPRPLPLSKRNEANLNHVMFPPDELERLGASFKGGAFLRDHNRWSLLAVGGIIESSEALAEGDWIAFRQGLHLQADWAVRAALEGTLRTFSIGWGLRRGAKFRDSLMCSVCAGPWIGGDCTHWPGDEVKLDGSGAKVIVELIYRNAQGAETSGVPFPAVAGTKIDDVTKLTQDQRGNPMREKLIQALKLAADATDADIAAAIEKLTASAAEVDGLRAQLAQQTAVVASRDEQLAAATGDREALRASYDKLAAHVRKEAADGLVARALAEGRMRPGQEATESLIRTLAEADLKADPTAKLKAATEFVERLDRLDPIGAPAQTPEPAPKASADNNFGLSARQLDYCRQAGVEPKRYRELLDEEQEQQGA